MGLGKALYVELSFIGLAETMTQDDSAQEVHAFARMDAQRVTWRMIEIARAANLLPRWPSASGDDVGQQSILDQSDPVLQQQLFLLQPLQGNLIARADGLQGADRVVKVAMLTAEHLKLDSQYVVGLHRDVGGRVHVRTPAI